MSESRSRASALSLLVFALTCLALPASAADSYSYDVQGRLTQVAYDSGRITTYTYDANGNILSIVTSLAATAVDGAAAPPAFALGPAVPNPGDASLFTFSLPRESPVVVRIFDASGRVMETLVRGTFPAGVHQVRFRSDRWAAGVYFYRLDTPGFAKTRKLVVLR